MLDSAEVCGRTATWLLGLGLAVASITPLCFSVPVPANNPFGNDHVHIAPPSSLCLKRDELSWLVFDTALVLLVTALALAAAWWRNLRRPASPGPPPAPPAAPKALPRPLARRSYTPSDMALLAIWSAWNVAALAAPLAFFDVAKPYWLEDAPPGSPPPSQAGLWTYAVGAVAAWPAMGNFFLATVTGFRASPLFDLLGVRAEDARWVHKLTSRAAVAWVAVHGVLCQAPMLSVSYYLFVWQNWTFSTPAGFWNLSGNLSLLVGAVIVATSMAAVRHRAYEAFRAVHYTLWLVVFFAYWHYTVSWWYFVPGLVLYAADLVQRWLLLTYPVNATVQVAAGGNAKSGGDRYLLLYADLAKPCVAGSTVYLCAPTISRLEWHAMTIASTSEGGKRACLVIKACGGWSDALYALADAADAPGCAAELPLLMEGPYPSRAAARAVRAAAGGASVVLVGGGSGVTPFTAVLEEALAAAGAAGESHDGAAAKQQGGLMHRLRLVWVLRSLEVVASVQPLLHRAAAAGAAIDIHITQGASDPEHAALPSKAPPPALPSPLSPPRRAARGSMLPHLIEALLIVAAVLGAAAGYVAGGALACNYHLEPSDPRWGPLEASYNASVLAASGGAWPKGQPALADTAPSVCRLAGRADVIGDYCQVDYTTQAKWPSGVQPTACQPIGLCFILPGTLNIILAVAGMLLTPAAAAFLVRSWRLRRGADGPRAGSAERPPAGRGPSPDGHVNIHDEAGGAFKTISAAAFDAAASAGADIRFHAGRPDLHALVADAAACKGGAHVFVCGPRALTQGVAEAACAPTGGRRVHVHPISWEV